MAVPEDSSNDDPELRTTVDFDVPCLLSMDHKLGFEYDNY